MDAGLRVDGGGDRVCPLPRHRRDGRRAAGIAAADVGPGASLHQQQQLAAHGRAPVRQRFATCNTSRCAAWWIPPDPSKSFDQMHLTADGNRLVAERLAGRRCESSRCGSRVESHGTQGPQESRTLVWPVGRHRAAVDRRHSRCGAAAIMRRRVDWRRRGGAGLVRCAAAVVALLPEQGVVALCDRARVGQRAHHPDARVRHRADPDVAGVASHRPRSAAAPA